MCFSLSRLCFVGLFGWWVYYLGVVRFSCVFIVFLRVCKQNSSVVFVAFLLLWFSVYCSVVLVLFLYVFSLSCLAWVLGGS